jgi:hypothetical protein
VSPTTELNEIVADAQKLALAQVKEAGALSVKAFQANVDLAERVLAYQRGAFERFAGKFEQAQ